jgi:hypothetical protein
MRRWGVALTGLGLALPLLVKCLPHPIEPPGHNRVEGAESFVGHLSQALRVRAPWGTINIGIAIVLLCNAVGLMMLAFYLRTRRRDNIVWLLAFVIGLVGTLEAIFQW